MIDIPKSQQQGEAAWNDVGHWFPVQNSDGSPNAILVCPTCQRPGSLTSHTIDAAGVVSPSVQCGYKDCTYHEWVRLLDWPGGAT